MSAELGLQAALVALWRADARVDEVISGRIHDRVPRERTFPYAFFGPSQTLDSDEGCGERWTVFQDVHVESRDVGRVEARRAADAMRRALRLAYRAGSLTAEGVTIEQARVRDVREPSTADGISSRVILVIEAIVHTTDTGE